MDLGRKRPADEAIFVPPSFASLDWIFPVPLCHPLSADLSLQAGLSSQILCPLGDNSLHLLD